MTIVKYRKELEQELQSDLNIYLTSDFSIGKSQSSYLENITDILQNDKIDLSYYLEDLAEYFYLLGLYRLHYQQPKETTATAFYAYLLLYANKNAGKYPPLVLMRKACMLWSTLYVNGWHQCALDVGTEFVNSVNGQASIIRHGNRNNPEAWFLLELFCLSQNKQINRARADYASDADMQIFNKVLSQWDTQDATVLDNNVTMLCEQQLLLSVIDAEQNQDDDDDVLPFYHPVMNMYPFIALMYLAIRKRKGLTNPSQYSHYLMTDQMTDYYCDTPIALSQNIPYQEEIIAAFKRSNPEKNSPFFDFK